LAHGVAREAHRAHTEALGSSVQMRCVSCPSDGEERNQDNEDNPNIDAHQSRLLPPVRTRRYTEAKDSPGHRIRGFKDFWHQTNPPCLDETNLPDLDRGQRQAHGFSSKGREIAIVYAGWDNAKVVQAHQVSELRAS